MESTDVLDVRRNEPRAVDEEVGVDDRQVDVVNQLGHGKHFRETATDVLGGCRGLLHHEQVVTDVENEVDDPLEEVHPGAEPGEESWHQGRRVEDRRVHDLAAVKAEAPVAGDGHPERPRQGEAALVGDHVHDDLKSKS